MDQVFIQGLRLMTIIGVYDWERTKPREIIVDITLYTDIRAAGESDNLSDCIDYDALTEEIRKLAAASNRFTIEALATDIAKTCLAEQRVHGVRVRLHKPGAVSQAASVGVEIERFKEIST